MVGKDLIMATLFGSGGGSPGGGSGGGGESEKSPLDALVDGSITEISSDVDMIKSYCFLNCYTLTSAKFPNANNTNDYAFQNCRMLETVELPKMNAVYKYTFSGCTALPKVILPSATYIYNNAFEKCKALEMADFPKATYFFASAFSNCSALTALIIRTASGAATLGSTSAFSSTPIASGTGYIYVPAALVDTYKSATNWSTFADQFRALEDYTVDGTITGELDESKI